MAIYTIRISRGLSTTEGKTNRKPAFHVLAVIPGDKKINYATRKIFNERTYYKSAFLTDDQRDIIRMAILSPHYNETRTIITYPKKSVMLNSFSTAEKNTLKVKGPITEKLGGTLTFSNFVITID